MLSRANDSFQSEAYLTALEDYREAYVRETSNDVKGRILFQIAECYRKMNEYEEAMKWYERAEKMNYNEPKMYMYNAMGFMLKQDYDNARTQIQKYLKEEPSSETGRNILESCNKAPKWLANPEKWEVKNVEEINSPSYDFAPAFLDKKNSQVMFTSARMGSSGDNMDDRTGENFSDLWVATVDRKGVWSEASLVPGINTEESHEGSAKMNYKRNTIYYTQCPFDKKEKLGCSIFQASYIGGRLSNVVKLDDLKMGKGDSVSIGHAAVNKKGNIMVYSAELPGGRGGKDLYVTTYDKKTKEWSTPKNLGPKINTAGDEVYPFIHADDRLFFASNGHVGLGGLDIYVSESVGEARYGDPKNLKAPLNSEANDFGIVWNKLKPEGFFSSNRKGGKGQDDIYSFLLPPPEFTLGGKVYDAETNQAISGLAVTVKDALGISFSANTDAGGVYGFDKKSSGDPYIVADKDYIIEVKKNGYLVATDQISTKNLIEDKSFIKDFVLVPMKVNKSIEMPEVLFKFNSAEFAANGADSLNYLYDILVNNPGIQVQLEAHTDSRGEDDFNLNLSQKRAEACVNYLTTKGIEAGRLKAKGFGETKPKVAESVINSMTSEEAREEAYQKNRRVEFSILKTNYVAGGTGQ